MFGEPARHGTAEEDGEDEDEEEEEEVRAERTNVNDPIPFGKTRLTSRHVRYTTA